MTTSHESAPMLEKTLILATLVAWTAGIGAVYAGATAASAAFFSSAAVGAAGLWMLAIIDGEEV